MHYIRPYKSFIRFFNFPCVVYDMILGNIIEPRIEGKNLGISPVAILISLSIWGYIWGFTGMLLAVPLTVIIKIICENLDYMKGVAIILGGDPRQTENKKD